MSGDGEREGVDRGEEGGDEGGIWVDTKEGEKSGVMRRNKKCGLMV